MSDPLSQHQQAVNKVKRWRLDPCFFVRDQFGVEPDRWQVKALESFAQTKNARLALSACAGPGKTAVLAWIGWNFMACYGEAGHHPVGAAVSINYDNLRDNLWKEFSVWRSRSRFLQSTFEWTKEKIYAKSSPETWFISARTWSKNADPEQQGRTLSGLHSKYIIYLIDESGDIAPSVLRSAEQGLGNCLIGKIVQAGNPTSRSGVLYLAHSTQRHLWALIRISGDPDDPDRSPRIGIDWAREQIGLYGRENPWVMSYILGQFPPQSINSLLTPEEVEEALNRNIPPQDYDFAQKRLGIDVARFGADRTVIFPRQGLQAFNPVVMRGARTTDIAARASMAIERWGAELTFVDDSGHWGHGVIDNLISAGHKVVPVFFEGKAINPRYFNKRTEMWLEMAEWIKRGGGLPSLPELVRELSAPTYTFVNGVFRLEPKDLLKKRIGVSPDLGDGLCLSFFMADSPSEAHLPMGLRKQGKMKSDYNPIADGVK